MSDTVHLVAPRAKDAVGTFVQRRETFTAYDITRYLRANLTVSVDHNYAVRPVVHAEMQQHLDSKAYTRVLKDYPGLKDHDLDGEIETRPCRSRRV